MADEGTRSASDGGTVGDRPPDTLSGRERDVELVQPHLGAVLHLATAMMGPADAEDPAQEAILSGMQAWPTLRDERAFKSWLLRIVYRVCIDLKRGRFGAGQVRTQPLPEAGDEALGPSVSA